VTTPDASEALVFRDDRLSKMDSSELPVALFDAPRTILHLVPTSAFEAGAHVALAALAASAPRRGPGGEELEAFFNFEGFVQRIAGEDETSLSYVQVFRSGAVEIVYADLLMSDGEENSVDTARLERTLIGAARQWLTLQKDLGARAPVFVMLSLQRVRGLSLDGDVKAGGEDAAVHPIDRDELIVPEAVLPSFDDDVARGLKPLFDAVWNAAGYAESKNFSRDGEWIGS
jgi:hypothetical protein